VRGLRLAGEIGDRDRKSARARARDIDDEFGLRRKSEKAKATRKQPKFVESVQKKSPA
jgi:hypothetical protein